MGTALLPSDWRQVCGKVQHGPEEHTPKCTQWICPQGQRYKTWAEVQAYFQLLSFEDDIPGVECRPENAKLVDTADQDVTLEEEVARREEKKGLVEEGEDSRKRARGKNKGDDEDYTPGKGELKKVESTTSSVPNKRTRRSLPANTGSKKEAVGAAKAGNTTLEETTKVPTSGATVTKSVSTRGLNSSVTISEVKKVPDVIEVTSSEDTLNPATQKLFNERFESFKQYCAGVDSKVDPVYAGEKTVMMFLNNLALKKNINKSVQEGYRQAIQQVQGTLKELRKQTDSRSTAVAGARPQAPRVSAPRQQTPAVVTARQPAPRAMVPRQTVSNTRQVVPVARQAAPSHQQVATRPQQAAPRPRQATPSPRQSNPSPRQAAPRAAAPRAVAPRATTATVTRPQGSIQGIAIAAQHTQLPAYLTSQVSFPCRLEVNSGGGESLYRAAAQHAGLGQEAFKELRRYCHTKLAEWWQWYEPYYAFPIQVKLKMKSATVQRNIPSPAAFKEFLKSDDSLLSWNVSECETYCLANVMGVAIHQLTFNLAGVAGRPEQRCKWDMLEPHQGLVHQNKFVRNKEPLYVLHEDKVSFTRIVKAIK